MHLEVAHSSQALTATPMVAADTVDTGTSRQLFATVAHMEALSSYAIAENPDTAEVGS